MTYETGASSHLDRMNLTKRLCQLLEPVFDEMGLVHCEYGQDILLAGNGSMLARLKKLDVKKSDVICMTKFAPDYILSSPKNKKLFMLDAKASITPMFFPSAIKNLRFWSKVDSLDHHTIGEIEREAWDNYVKRFPPKKLAICMAAPYHPRLLVAEWATDLKELHRFAGDLNEEAGGSGTPHVNIDLGAMRPLDKFLEEECDTAIDAQSYSEVLEDIKQWGLNKPGRVNWTQFNNVIVNLHPKCPWLKGRLPKAHANRQRIESRLDQSDVDYDLF